MTRISQSQLRLAAVTQLETLKGDYLKYSNEVSSGLKAASPGDTLFSATIVSNNQALQRIASQQTRLASVTANLAFQEQSISQSSNVLIRGQEIATQAGNTATTVSGRSQMAAEVWGLRDQMVNLANSQYEGQYVFGGLEDAKAPFTASTYTTPATGAASKRYVYDNATTDPASRMTRTVNVTDQVSVDTQVSGSKIFADSISALERLGRALDGYKTATPGTADSEGVGPLPDGTGAAYVMPDEYAQQTADILSALDALGTARSTHIIPSQTSIGSKTAYLDNISTLLDSQKANSKSVISELRDADIDESASQLTQTQTALQASYQVSTQMLKLSILDYL